MNPAKPPKDSGPQSRVRIGEPATSVSWPSTVPPDSIAIRRTKRLFGIRRRIDEPSAGARRDGGPKDGSFIGDATRAFNARRLSPSPQSGGEGVPKGQAIVPFRPFGKKPPFLLPPR